jgi:hypothetical protein
MDKIFPVPVFDIKLLKILPKAISQRVKKISFLSLVNVVNRACACDDF